MKLKGWAVVAGLLIGAFVVMPWAFGHLLLYFWAFLFVPMLVGTWKHGEKVGARRERKQLGR